MMGWLWAAHSKPDNVLCHFCSSNLVLVPADSVPAPPQTTPTAHGTALRFDCSVCGCTNLFSEDGEVLSDPAGLDELSQVNIRSRSLAGTPVRKTAPAENPFCRSCSSNQLISLQLRASLPSDDNDAALDPLTIEYLATLADRYPLLCAACAPKVEGIIASRDYRARAALLGSSLSRTRSVRKEATAEGWRRWHLQAFVWRLRGLLWAGTEAGSLAVLATHAFPALARYIPSSAPELLIAVLSLPYAFWDPHWLAERTAKARGRPVARGRSRMAWRVLQGVKWLARLGWAAYAALSVESNGTVALQVLLLLAALSMVTLCMLLRPPAAPAHKRLFGTRSSAAAVFEGETDESSHVLDQLEDLSLANARFPAFRRRRTRQIGTPLVGAARASTPTLEASRRAAMKPESEFGQTGFGFSPAGAAGSGRRALAGEADDGDVNMSYVSDYDDEHETTMDIDNHDTTSFPPSSSTPSRSFARPVGSGSAQQRESIFLGPQRFFPPQEPTGLEGLFETGLRVQEDVPMLEQNDGKSWTSWAKGLLG